MENDLVSAVYAVAISIVVFGLGIIGGLCVIALELKEIKKSMATSAQALTDLQNLIANLTTAIGQAVTDIAALIQQISTLHGLNPTAVEAVVAQGNTALANLQTALTEAQSALNPPTPVAVAVSPATATIAVGATQQFSATVTGNTNTAVTWSASSGTIDQTGLFTAPATAGSATITATAQADGTTVGTASVSFS